MLSPAGCCCDGGGGGGGGGAGAGAGADDDDDANAGTGAGASAADFSAAFRATSLINLAYSPFFADGVLFACLGDW